MINERDYEAIWQATRFVTNHSHSRAQLLSDALECMLHPDQKRVIDTAILCKDFYGLFTKIMRQVYPSYRPVQGSRKLDECAKNALTACLSSGACGIKLVDIAATEVPMSDTNRRKFEQVFTHM